MSRSGFRATGFGGADAATGVAVFDANTAEEWGKAGKAVIMVRPETNPDDVHGMLVAKGILTQRGGATSHAAVVARGLGLPCVAGCESIRVDADKKLFVTDDGKTVKQGDYISIDGTSGEVLAGQVATIRPEFDKETDLVTLLSWADEVRRAGGPLVRSAELSNVVIVRHRETRRYGGAVDLSEACLGREGKPFYLEPQDIVFVPRTRISEINQWIDEHITRMVPQFGFFFSVPVGTTTDRDQHVQLKRSAMERTCARRRP